MTNRYGDSEPTHSLPKELEDKLVEAKRWDDKRQEMIDANFPDAGEWNDSVAAGNTLLHEIVEIIAQTWGFAQ